MEKPLSAWPMKSSSREKCLDHIGYSALRIGTKKNVVRDTHYA